MKEKENTKSIIRRFKQQLVELECRYQFNKELITEIEYRKKIISDLEELERYRKMYKGF